VKRQFVQADLLSGADERLEERVAAQRRSVPAHEQPLVSGVLVQVQPDDRH
jgi:hypothetical protein